MKRIQSCSIRLNLGLSALGSFNGAVSEDVVIVIPRKLTLTHSPSDLDTSIHNQDSPYNSISPACFALLCCFSSRPCHRDQHVASPTGAFSCSESARRPTSRTRERSSQPTHCYRVDVYAHSHSKSRPCLSDARRDWSSRHCSSLLAWQS